MTLRAPALVTAALSALTLGAIAASPAQAGILSILPGSCGAQPASQPFAQWGDLSSYTPVPGGSFEIADWPWQLAGGTTTVAGNETYHVRAASDSRSLALPASGSATSVYSCTSIYHPTLRFFVRNTGSASSHLIVQALYPGLLGGIQTTTLGELSASSTWQPSPSMPLLVSNLLATLSLDQTAIAFRFTPADSTGAWSIDDVYLDPWARS